MSGLDFSNCKKISHDKNCAVFKHDDGHEIKIALSGLSSTLRKRLEKLPLHKAGEDEPPENAVVESPEVAAEPTQSTEPSFPVPSAEEAVAEQQAAAAPSVPIAEPTAPVPTAAVPSLDPASAPTAAVSHGAPQIVPPSAEAPKPVEAPQQNGLPPEPMLNKPLTPAQEIEKRNMDQMAFDGDLGSGKIKPKTISELAADKGTVGRITTIFGLLLSGLGSGLTGQPNMAMEMMNKEIERDFEAQKQNQSNRQSWYKMAMEHEKNQADNALTRAHTSGIDFENMSKEQKALFDKWQNKQIGVTDMLGTESGLNYSTTAYLRMMSDEINKMPEGPAKAAMQQRYNNEVVPFFMNKMQMRTAEAVGKKHIVNATNPMPNLPKKNAGGAAGGADKYAFAPVADTKGIQKGILLGKASPYAKGAILPEDASEINREITNVEQIRRAGKRWEEAYNKLNNLPHKGESAAGFASDVGAKFLGAVPMVSAEGVDSLGQEAKKRFERERQAIIGGVAASLPAGTIDERRALVDAYLPKWGDSSSVEKNTFEGGFKHFRDLEKTPYLDKYPQYKLSPQEYKLEKPKQTKEEKGKVKVEGGHVVGKSGKVYK